LAEQQSFCVNYRGTLFHGSGNSSTNIPRKFAIVIGGAFSEPTNNIPPKTPGKRYAAGEIVAPPSGTTVFLTCNVPGFPVPFYR